MKARTAGELAFERYLSTVAIKDFDYEPELPGSQRRPDYVLHHDGDSLLFDVKDFAAHEPIRGPKFVDIYGPIRGKIDKAKEKFKQLRQYCCCLVLYRDQNQIVMLDTDSVYGAMLGDLGIEIPMGAEKSEWGFYGRTGRMYEYKHGLIVGTKNTTVSAMIVVEECHIGMMRHLASIGNDAVRPGMPIDTSEIVIRTCTYENPFARIPLPDDLPGLLFRGQFDERFGPEEGRLIRKFAGAGWLEVQAVKGEQSPFE